MSDSEQFERAGIFSGKSVLVVEDEFLIALDIERILESAGVTQVACASRVAQALEFCDTRGPFDAAILDLKLEREASTAVAERLHAAAVPFLFLTGGPSQSDITKRFANAPVVGKPFDSTVLLSALAKILSSKG
jgi:CheY-like chemotaxis protein